MNNLCGCGATLPECPVWSEILSIGRPPGVSAEQHAATVIRRQRAVVRTRHTWRVLRHGINSSDLREHAELMSAVYRASAERTGARVLVDTTKIPGEAALLPRLPGIRTVFVHLVRDPLAVSNSWRTPKDYVYTMSASKNTAYWRAFNIASRALLRRYPERSMLLRYEDFIADPAGTVDTLLRMCGADPRQPDARAERLAAYQSHGHRQPGPVPNRRDGDPAPGRLLAHRAAPVGPACHPGGGLADGLALRLPSSELVARSAIGEAGTEGAGLGGNRWIWGLTAR